MFDEKYYVYKIDGSFVASLATIEAIMLGVVVLMGIEAIEPGMGAVVLVVISLFKSLVAGLNREEYPIDKLRL